MLLSVHDLHVSYEGAAVLRGVSFAVPAGTGLAILGGNGAGKTTTLRCLAGLVRPKRGQVVFDGRDLSRTPPHEIAALGVALVPEGRRLFPDHTVRENLELGGYHLLRVGKRAEFERAVEEMTTIFPLIAERSRQPAGQLSGGEQQMVAIARALVARPRVLLLDEPSLGLAPALVDGIFRRLTALMAGGLTVIVAEQAAVAALRCCGQAVVLQNGGVALAGPSEQLVANKRLLDAYIGSLAPPTDAASKTIDLGGSPDG